MSQIAIRMSDELLKRIDEFKRRKQDEIPYKEITRSDAIRMLLHKALDLVEKGYTLELIAGADFIKKAEELMENEQISVPVKSEEPLAVKFMGCPECGTRTSVYYRKRIFGENKIKYKCENCGTKWFTDQNNDKPQGVQLGEGVQK